MAAQNNYARVSRPVEEVKAAMNAASARYTSQVQAPRIGISGDDPALWGFSSTLKYPRDAVQSFKDQLQRIQMEVMPFFVEHLSEIEVPFKLEPTFVLVGTDTYNKIEATEIIGNNIALTLVLVLNPNDILKQRREAGVIQYYFMDADRNINFFDRATLLSIYTACFAAIDAYKETLPPDSFIGNIDNPEKGLATFRFQQRYNPATPGLIFEFSLIPVLKSIINYLVINGDGEIVGSTIPTNFIRYNSLGSDFRGFREMVYVLKLVHQTGAKESGYMNTVPSYAFEVVMRYLLEENHDVSKWWRESTFKQIFDTALWTIEMHLDNRKILPSPILATHDVLAEIRSNSAGFRSWVQAWRKYTEPELIDALNDCLN